MRTRTTLLVLALWSVCSLLGAYEWRSHNRMALQARALVLRIATDDDLGKFLRTYGEEYLDTRAGDHDEGQNVDEDETEGGCVHTP